MAQAQTTTTTETDTTNGNGNGKGKGKREPKALTAADVIGRINKMLEQLTPLDQKRVLAFFNVQESAS